MKFLKLATIFIGLLFIFCTATVFAQDGAMKIAEASGKVLVKISPSQDWVDAAAGQTLNINDAIKTGDDGKATVELTDKSGFALKPNTEISVEELVLDATARKVSVNMTAGELKAIIQKADTPSDFKIRTPTAVCGARGTIFVVVVTPAGTKLYVAENTVEFTSIITGQTTNVIVGMASDIDKDGNVVEPYELSVDEANALLSGYGLGPIAETYTEPANEPRDPNDITAPDVTVEAPASQS